MNTTLSKDLDLLRKEYLENSNLKSYFDINNGDCYEFSDLVYRRLKDKYNLEELYTDDLCEVDESGLVLSSIFDEELLLRHTKGKLPLGLSIEQLNVLDIVPHCFVTDGLKYYDAECIDGVDNIFDLPIYVREFHAFKKYLTETNNISNGIISSSDIDIINNYNIWTRDFFKFTSEFDNALEFWTAKFPELF